MRANDMFGLGRRFGHQGSVLGRLTKFFGPQSEEERLARRVETILNSDRYKIERPLEDRSFDEEMDHHVAPEKGPADEDAFGASAEIMGVGVDGSANDEPMPFGEDEPMSFGEDEPMSFGGDEGMLLPGGMAVSRQPGRPASQMNLKSIGDLVLSQPDEDHDMMHSLGERMMEDAVSEIRRDLQNLSPSQESQAGSAVSSGKRAPATPLAFNFSPSRLSQYGSSVKASQVDRLPGSQSLGSRRASSSGGGPLGGGGGSVALSASRGKLFSRRSFFKPEQLEAVFDLDFGTGESANSSNVASRGRRQSKASSVFSGAETPFEKAGEQVVGASSSVRDGDLLSADAGAAADPVGRSRTPHPLFAIPSPSLRSPSVAAGGAMSGEQLQEVLSRNSGARRSSDGSVLPPFEGEIPAFEFAPEPSEFGASPTPCSPGSAPPASPVFVHPKGSPSPPSYPLKGKGSSPPFPLNNSTAMDGMMQKGASPHFSPPPDASPGENVSNNNANFSSGQRGYSFSAADSDAGADFLPDLHLPPPEPQAPQHHNRVRQHCQDNIGRQKHFLFADFLDGLRTPDGRSYDDAEIALAFYELLELSNDGELEPIQSEPYGDIQVSVLA